METQKILAILTFASMISACASTTYRIQSSPSEAEVDFVYKSGTRKSMGKTPLSLNASEANPNKESFQIEVRKDGFDRQAVFVPESSFSKNLEVNVNLTADARSGDAKKGDAAFNDIASAVADVQKDIQTKNYEIALTKLNRMVAQYPSVSTFYSLTGNVHYLERRLEKALASYKRALELNPNSSELQKIIEKLDGLNGGSR
ncbi:MAG: tetratricopeptide repeat protein [Bdellovibrionaceae bacterium]|nr:tetratricopeptide repeat protein [Pseudobdellovibrionaceae bacterium]